jgi:hypothetical protein
MHLLHFLRLRPRRRISASSTSANRHFANSMSTTSRVTQKSSSLIVSSICFTRKTSQVRSSSSLSSRRPAQALADPSLPSMSCLFDRTELNLLLSQLTPAQRAPACVQHALKVQSALATSNYHAFFVLFNEAPNMGAYMMDHFVDRERIVALATMSKA